MKKIYNIFAAIFLVLLIANSAFAISETEEREAGLQAATSLEKQYGVLTAHPELSKITDMGNKIVAVSERPQLQYTFKILDTDEVNAVSCPGGFVYVTKGIISILTEDELSFVLGHEIAHVALSHGLKQARQNAYTKIGLASLANIINKGKSSKGSETAISLASTVLASGYSRADETEADKAACRYISKGLGKNPRAGISLMQKLKNTNKQMPGFLNALIGSHPLTEERIKDIEDECIKLGY